MSDELYTIVSQVPEMISFIRLLFC